MKRLLTKCSVLPALLLLALVSAAAQPRSRPQTDTTRAPHQRTFHDIQREFYEYWKDRDSTRRGEGWKQFKRWEWFWAQRVDRDGHFPMPTILYDEWLKEQQRLQQEQHTGGGGKRGREKTLAPGNWTPLGPEGIPASTLYNSGSGRINCVRIVSTSANVLWIGTAGGGVWKSTNTGTTWNNKSANLPILGVSDIAVTTTGTVFIATGDADGSLSSTPGYTMGVMKSTDDGATWSTTALIHAITPDQLSVYRLLVHSSGNTVLAAGNGSIRMLTNGGSAVASVLTVANARFTDMEFHPTNPLIVYVGCWNIATTTASVYRSTDGGGTWTQVAAYTSATRVALAVSPAAPDVVYALLVDTERGFHSIHRSTTAGVTWTTQATRNVAGCSNILHADITTATGGQGWYDLALAVSPTHADSVFAGGVNVWLSTNAGVTWTIKTDWAARGGVPYMHADHHDLVFAPGSSRRLYSGNDGGLWRSDDAGATWSNAGLNNGLSIMQIYRLSSAVGNATTIVVGAQDNGTNKRTGAAPTNWSHILGGDGMECIVDYSNANTMYASHYQGALRRSTNAGVSFTDIQPAGTTGAWVTPYVQHPTNPQVLFVGYEAVYRSANAGMSWTTMATLPLLPVAGRSRKISCLACAPSNPNVLYAGSYTGQLFSTTHSMTASSADEWTPHMSGFSLFTPITSIAVHPSDPQKLWLAHGGYNSGQKVYVSTNSAVSFTNYSDGLPNLPVNCIVYQNNSPDVLYAGTDLGVYYRHAGMKRWEPFKTNLPNVIVLDLEVHETTGTLRAATYGRSVWQSPLYRPDLLVLSPNGGERWVNGTTSTIRWFSPATTALLTIQYSLSGGTTWSTLTTTASATTGSFTWLVPDITSTHALVRIFHSANTAVSDTSDAPFAIEPIIRLVAPFGGQELPAASTTAIRWERHTQATVTTLTLQYRLSTTAAWATIATVAAPTTTGTYIWTVPATTSTQASVRVVFYTTATTSLPGVSSATITDATACSIVNPITLLAPNGNQKLIVTSGTWIQWALHTQATVTTLTVQYRPNTTALWTTLAVTPATGTTGSLYWITPTTATTQGALRISLTTAASIYDDSDGPISIVEPLTLLHPNGGELFTGGSTTTLTWSRVTDANVVVTEIDIAYSTTAGVTWTQITAATTATTGTFTWLVPEVSTTQALIRIRCSTNPHWSDTSNGPFRIATCGNMMASLDGTDDYLEATGVATPAALTLEAWVVVDGASSTKYGADSSDQYILFRRNSRSGSGNEAVALVFDETHRLFKAVAVSSGGARTVVSSPVNSADLYTPIHVALTASSSELALYINGRLQGKKPTGYALDQATSSLWFGRTGDTANDGLFHGRIDEVRLWNSVRSESAIYGTMYQRSLAPQAALVGYWPIDNAMAGVAGDESGHGHDAVPSGGVAQVAFPLGTDAFTWPIDGPGLIVAPASTGTYSVPAVAGTAYSWQVINGTITGGQGTAQVTVQWNADSASSGSISVATTPLLHCGTYAELTVEFTGCTNYALAFDGWDDKVELINSALVTDTAFTLEAWVHPSVYSYDSTMRSILGSRQLHAAERPPVFGVQGTAVYAGFGDGTTWHSTTADSVLTTGVWQHVAVTFDGTTMKVYINGEERHSTTAFSGSTPFPAPIGCIGSGEGTFYGTIDEVRVWNSARSQNAIQEAMYCRFAQAQPGMLGYWRFDEDSYLYYYTSPARDIAAWNDGAVYGAWRTYASLPAPPISGPDSAAANTGGYVYCAPESACASYVWSISGGTITAGQNTRCVTVTWGAPYGGMLSVSTEGESSCGSSSSMYVAILPPPIEVIDPDSGDVVAAGMPTAIVWMQSYTATTAVVAIELSTDNGATWTLITAATPSYAGTMSYAWIPPSVTTTQAWIRIRDVADPSISALGGPFSIQLLLPPDTVTATAGSGVVALSWTPSPGSTGYSVYVRPAWSPTFSQLAVLPSGTTSYLDTAVVNGTWYSYAVTALDGNSESAFSTVVSALPVGSTLALLSPNGGELLTAGMPVPITWMAGGPDTVVLEYTCNNGGLWTPVATVAGSTSYLWTPPYQPTAQARLRIRTLTSSAIDSSDGVFSIRSGYETAVNIRLLLEGAYTGSGAMRTDLDAMSFLPPVQPYSGPPFFYSGMETRGMCVADPIVDWVLIDLRSAANPALSVARTAALLRADGVVLDESGYPEALLSAPPGWYYIAVQHRNHLEVMSAVPVYLSTGSSTQYTFTTAQTQAYIDFMPTMKQVAPGVFALSGGEARNSDVIDAIDRVEVINALGSVGYRAEDITCDGVVTALDRVLTENNQFLVSQVP